MQIKPQFTPLYAQIKQALLKRIIAGEWAPGSFLPSEYALAGEYGVSQGTLRKAINELADEKLVIRYQGRGTAVAVLDEDSALFPFFLLSDMAGKRVFPSSLIYSVTRKSPDQDIAKALRIPETDDQVIYIYRIRELDGKPEINEMVCLPESRFPGFPASIETVPNTLYKYYQLRYSVTIARVSETLIAVNASEEDARLLKVHRKTPLLEVRRVAYDLAGIPVECRVSRINTAHYMYHGSPY